MKWCEEIAIIIDEEELAEILGWLENIEQGNVTAMHYSEYIDLYDKNDNLIAEIQRNSVETENASFSVGGISSELFAKYFNESN